MKSIIARLFRFYIGILRSVIRKKIQIYIYIQCTCITVICNFKKYEQSSYSNYTLLSTRQSIYITLVGETVLFSYTMQVRYILYYKCSHTPSSSRCLIIYKRKDLFYYNLCKYYIHTRVQYFYELCDKNIIIQINVKMYCSCITNII